MAATDDRKQSRTKFRSPAIGTAADIPVVGVGASAGGLQALSELLSALPARPGFALVVIQHLDPTYRSNLVELLQRKTELKVTEAAPDTPIAPDTVYVIPPGQTLTLSHDRFLLEARGQSRKPHLSIDAFFSSLAKERGPRSIGVLLSGTGSDGTEGLKAIRSQGGLGFAQESSGATYPEMPDFAARSGAVDVVLPAADIAWELVRVTRETPEVVHELKNADRRVAEAEEAQRKLFALLKSKFGVDFSMYKESTVRNRIARRMVLQKTPTLADYLGFLSSQPEELQALFDDLLIPVTSFFRDPELFAFVGDSLLPRLLKEAGRTSLRIWVAGCSTGEEAYSLGMAIIEYLSRERLQVPVQLFATDVSEAAVEKARRGVYREEALKGVSEERRRRFFLRTNDGWQIAKQIRDICIFSRHDITFDPPFSNIDIVSCRNLLIYLNLAMQRKVLGRLCYSLQQPGYLVLGMSETADSTPQLFEPVEKKLRVYLRAEGQLALPATAFRAERRAKEPGSTLPEGGFNLTREVERLLLKQHVHPAILVNAQQNILKFYGEVGRFLEPTAGSASLSLGKMLKPSLMRELHLLLSEVRKTGKAVRKRHTPVVLEGERVQVDLEVVPIGREPLSDPEYLLVVVDEDPTSSASASDLVEAAGERAAVVEQLQEELERTRAYLQTLVEEHEINNEKLRATVEELQCANEELITLNEEMHGKNEELLVVNGDLINVLTSVTLPIVILDSNLCIRRFTPPSEHTLNLVRGDVGRPFADLRFAGESEVMGVIREVAESLAPRVVEVMARDDRWYSLTVRPYRTMDNQIDGVVLVFIDIDETRRAMHVQQEATEYAEAIVDTVREPLLILGGDLKAISANQAFYRYFGVTRESTLGRHVYELQEKQWDISRLRMLLEEILPERTTMEGYAMEARFPERGVVKLNLNARKVVRREGKEQLILLAMMPVGGEGDAL